MPPTATLPVISPADAVTKLRNLSRLVREHQATREARSQELIDLIGDTDIEAVLKAAPEKFSEHAQTLSTLHAGMALAEMAIKGAAQRSRELMPIVAAEIDKLRARRESLQGDIQVRIQSAAEDLLAGVFPEERIPVFAKQTNLYREETALIADHVQNQSLDYVVGEKGQPVLSDRNTIEAVLRTFEYQSAAVIALEQHSASFKKRPKNA